MDTMRKEYRQLSIDECDRMARIKDLGEKFLDEIAVPRQDGMYAREFALARTKMEEAVMWAVKGVTG